MRRLGLVLVILVAFLAVGCAGGSESAQEEPPATTAAAPAPAAPEEPPAATEPATPTPEEPPAPVEPARLFTKAELGRLALRQADALPGMRLTKAESGAKTLFGIGFILDEQVEQVQSLGFRGVYDAIFDTSDGELRLSTRLWLFRAAAGAQQWLEKTRADSQAFQLAPVTAPQLAEGSWAARGNVNGSDIVSHAFRSGNVVVVVTLSSQFERVSESDALAVAQRAVARTRHA